MIHWSCRKSAGRTFSSVGKIAGMLEISSPSIRADRHTAANASLFPRDVCIPIIKPFVVMSATVVGA